MWQPIETAPKDQTFLAVLNCAGEQTICTMRWPVAAAEREACARCCETFAWMHPNASLLGPEQNRMDCAAAIRARGSTIPQTTHNNTVS